MSEHPVAQYALDVVREIEVAGPLIRGACKRHLDDLEHGHLRGLRFDEDRADHAMNFFPTVLRLNAGDFDGKPFVLHPSQEFIVGSLFGWQNRDNLRRFRVAYIEQGKGGGKTPLLAGIGLYGIVGDNEAKAEIFSAAKFGDIVELCGAETAIEASLQIAVQDFVQKCGFART